MPIYQNGDKIRAAFRATVLTGPDNQTQTTRVRELRPDGSGGFIHYLYLDSRSARERFLTNWPENSGLLVGDTIDVDFTATIDYDEQQGPDNTTRVRNGGYVHYLFKASTYVKPAPRPAPSSEPVVPGTLAPEQVTVLPEPEPVGRIFPLDSAIDSTRLVRRIAELRRKRSEQPGYTATQRRTGILLGTFATPEDALAAVDEADYQIGRFNIGFRTPELAGQDAGELAALEALDEAGREEYGFTRWAGTGVTLREERYFDEAWARDQAADKAEISPEDTENWPYDLVDWGDAADRLLESDYTPFAFGGTTTFYGLDADKL